MIPLANYQVQNTTRNNPMADINMGEVSGAHETPTASFSGSIPPRQVMTPWLVASIVPIGLSY